MTPSPTVAVTREFAVDYDSMISAETIEKAVRTLADAVKPTRIILFGSYARGDAREDSDVEATSSIPLTTESDQSPRESRYSAAPFCCRRKSMRMSVSTR